MIMKPRTLVLVGQHGKRCLFDWRNVFPILFLTLGIFLKKASSTGNECGRATVSHRIVGGNSTHLGKAPWMGSLYHRDYHICGVSILSRTWVVTAAHCVDARDPARLSVMLGTVNLTGPSSTRVFIGVKAVFLHPLFDGHGSSGDLALVELKLPINFTSNIHPICLPAPNQDFPDGMMCSLTGWGYTAENVRLPVPYTLQEVDLPLINAPACDDMFRAKYPELYTSGSIHSDMICAGYPNESKDGCQGDSGGPLACQVGDTWSLVGIVSWGIGCATPGIPGVYTKVSNFTSWIIGKSHLNYTFNTETIFSSTAVKTDASSTTVKTDASSTTVKTDASSTTVKTDASSTTVKTDASSTTVETDASSTTVKTDASSTTVKIDTFSTMVKTDSSSTTVKTDASSTTVKTDASSTMVNADNFSTLKPKQGAQSLTTNGANLRSSIPMSLLIISSIITNIPDII